VNRRRSLSHVRLKLRSLQKRPRGDGNTHPGAVSRGWTNRTDEIREGSELRKEKEPWRRRIRRRRRSPRPLRGADTLLDGTPLSDVAKTPLGVPTFHEPVPGELIHRGRYRRSSSRISTRVRRQAPSTGATVRSAR
jgi:hypothetical protein